MTKEDLSNWCANHPSCPVHENCDLCMYEKGRADATDEHFQKIMSFISTNNRGNCDYFIVDQIENYISEQLKKGAEK